MDDEKKLLDRLFNRQQHAAEDFVRLYARLVTQSIRSYRLSHEIVDDLTQAFFEKVWEDDFKVLRQWKGDGSLGGYLRRISQRLVIDRLRTPSRNIELPDDDTLDMLQVAQMANDPVLDQSALFEFKGILQSAVNQMSEGCRQRIMMKFFEDLDYDEIAEQLGTSINSVRVRVSQCLKELRHILQIGWRVEDMPL
jgi:RNA polymerase sigma-70 factor (ECF subfamily)